VADYCGGRTSRSFYPRLDAFTRLLSEDMVLLPGIINVAKDFGGSSREHRYNPEDDFKVWLMAAFLV
jgi:hypothetical protein